MNLVSHCGQCTHPYRSRYLGARSVLDLPQSHVLLQPGHLWGLLELYRDITPRIVKMLENIFEKTLSRMFAVLLHTTFFTLPHNVVPLVHPLTPVMLMPFVEKGVNKQAPHQQSSQKQNKYDDYSIHYSEHSCANVCISHPKLSGRIIADNIFQYFNMSWVAHTSAVPCSI